MVKRPSNPNIRLVLDANDPDIANKAARDYIRRGWSPIPWPLNTKGLKKKWVHLIGQVTEENVDKHFPRNVRMNVGVALGPGSNDLVDVDLDCREAVQLASYFLPSTDAIFGRIGKQRSHWLYYIHDAVGFSKSKITFETSEGMILELRLGIGDKGTQTIFPGSQHESGEEVEWANNGDPADVTFGEAQLACARLAVASLLLRCWPTVPGSRNTCAFIVGAFLARAGLSVEDIGYMVRAVATEAGDNEVEKRVEAACSSATNTLNGEQTYGLPKMIEQFGEENASKIAKFLDYSAVDADETLERMNEEWCVVPIGGKVFVMRFVEQEGRRVPEMYRPDEFKSLLNNIKVGKAGKGTWWLAQAARKQYRRVIFKPGKPKIVDDCLNLWQGWGIIPMEGKWKRLQQHIMDVLASGERIIYEYIIKWTAWTLQNPGQRAEVALVLQGGKGAGKGAFAVALKRAFGQHGIQISNLEHLTGKFNFHLIDCALLFADEAYWPGHKAAEGTLKRMLTEGSLFIEPKGAHTFEVDNALHIIMAANAEWVVPATHDERRYAVFHVSDKFIGNEKYFQALYEEMYAGGGIAAMMYELLKMDLKGWHPRRHVPKTTAMREQQMLSLTPFQQDWFGMLQDGCVHMLKDNKVPSAQLYERVRNRTPALRFHSYTALAEMFKSVGCETCMFERGLRGLRLPTLAEARTDWDKLFPGTTWNDAMEWSQSNEPT